MKEKIPVNHPVKLVGQEKNERDLWELTFEPEKYADTVSKTALKYGAITAGNF